MVKTKSRKKNKKKSSGEGSIILFPPGRIAELIFYSAVMFILGVFAGRSTAPFYFDLSDNKDFEKDIAPEKKDNPVNVDLDFYKKLMTDKGVEIDKNIIRDEKSLPLKSPVYDDKKKYVKQDFILIKKSDKEKKILSYVKASSENSFYFTVQVAALKKSSDAELLASKLRESGFNAYSVSGVSETGVNWYRVRVGRYSEKKICEETKKELFEKMKINGFVVKVN
ncbi:MAG: hypothetical protein CSA18_03780 [Deltaproteobacteria bacterium]|nr:MAG: hypothetical protein CSA18_03780 [Deltaproteobacteria bacterium]